MNQKELRELKERFMCPAPRKLEIGLLEVDHTYQRDDKQIDEKLIEKIVEDFDIDKFDVIRVAERKIGAIIKYMVTDGQHRVEAARRINQKYGVLIISSLWCKITREKGVIEEARGFVSSKEDRSNLKPYDYYKASVAGMLSPYVHISKWVKENDFIVVSGKGGSIDNRSIAFINKLVSTWKASPECSQRALLDQSAMLNKEDGLDYRIHIGLFFLARNGVTISDHVNRAKRAGGKSALLNAINKVRIEAKRVGMTGNAKLNAYGILDVINKGLRTKVRLENDYEV